MEDSQSDRRIALVLEYEGTGYSGFQWQANAPSIQAEVEQAIGRLTGERTRIRGASRTDAGAHAKGQVVDFLTRAPYTTRTFLRALNWHLPPDIKVTDVRDTDLDFNSRKDAVSREYRYTIFNALWPSAILRAFSHWVPARLDVAEMKVAAGYLPGVHDFSALAASLPSGKSGVRRIDRWDVWREGELILVECEANGFLPHQIRRTNGVLAEIGLGRMSREAIKAIVDGTVTSLQNCPSVPAKGLCLMNVNYPNLVERVEGQDEAT